MFKFRIFVIANLIGITKKKEKEFIKIKTIIVVMAIKYSQILKIVNFTSKKSYGRSALFFLI